ncbi:unnamed protein product [Pylaiella littoralis]
MMRWHILLATCNSRARVLQVFLGRKTVHTVFVRPRPIQQVCVRVCCRVYVSCRCFVDVLFVTWSVRRTGFDFVDHISQKKNDQGVISVHQCFPALGSHRQGLQMVACIYRILRGKFSCLSLPWCNQHACRARGVRGICHTPP